MTQARQAAEHIVRTLAEHGHVAYFAGGCVRDEVLGHEPSDYDVATDAPPARICELFPSAQEVGAAFGVMLVHSFKIVVEVATFREDAQYSDRRRPDSVRFSTAERDAQRRDFTINALFLDPFGEPDAAHPAICGRVIDYVGGLDDLEARCVRAVGDPSARLDEDHLRALRAVRFAARLGFTLDNATAEAIREHTSDLVGVSRERIGQEIKRMFEHESFGVSIALLTSLGLDAPVLGEASRAHSNKHVGVLSSEQSYPLVLAAWALDRLEIGVGQWDVRSRDVAALMIRWRESLCLSNVDRDGMGGILDSLRELEMHWEKRSEAWQKRLASGVHARSAMRLLRIRDEEVFASREASIERLSSRFGGLRPAALVTGQDLVDAGVESGPAIGRVLEEVYDAQLEGGVGDAAEAMAMAMRLLGETR
jgi:tRNA nucleotidyltransferase/poly(A) polymerase